jgi:hypothetical protein
MPFKIGSTSSKPFLGSGAVKYMTVGSTLVQPDWTLPGADTYSQFEESIARTNAAATVADTLTTPTGTYPGSGAFYGGVLLPDGRVFCVPPTPPPLASTIRWQTTLTTPSGTYPGSAAFLGGVLLPDGRVFCVPHNSTSSRIYDPVADNSPHPPARILGVAHSSAACSCLTAGSTASRTTPPPLASTIRSPTKSPHLLAHILGVAHSSAACSCLTAGSTACPWLLHLRSHLRSGRRRTHHADWHVSWECRIHRRRAPA